MPARVRPTSLEFLNLLLALLLSLATTTILALTLDSVGVSDAPRTARKVLVPVFILILVLVIRIRLRDAPRAFGLTPRESAVRAMAVGLAAGTGSILLLNAVLIVAGARRFDFEVGGPRFLMYIPQYLLQALVLGFLEEGLFRGLILGRLRDASGPAAAVTAGSALFAAAHFLRPPRDTPAEPLTVATDCLAGVVEAVAEPERRKELFGLFLVGAVLSVLRLRTGTIWLALGVHAGWVWVRLVADKGLAEVKPVVREHLLLLGTMRHYDGIAGWLALLSTLLVVLLLGRRTGDAPCPPRES